jgi:RNA polymerase-binding protein DksA
MTPDKARKTLIARREEITRRLDEIADQLVDPAPQDWDDAATEAEDDQMLETLGARQQAELARIDAALGRIEEGTYGECVKCGEPIAPKRLELLPETPLCANCAA